jgi:4-diphosphocytidyl-2-C-methyl-D-erythritol kinase
MVKERPVEGKSFDLDGLQLRNDLEPPVFEKYLILDLAREWLHTRPETRGAMMSGSGSTLFAILNGPQESQSLAEAFAREFGEDWWTWSGSTLASGETQGSLT